MTDFYFKSTFFSFCSLSFLQPGPTNAGNASSGSHFLSPWFHVSSFSFQRCSVSLPTSPLSTLSAVAWLGVLSSQQEKEEAYSHPMCARLACCCCSTGASPARPQHAPSPTSPPSSTSPGFSSCLIMPIFIHISLVSPILTSFFLIPESPSATSPSRWSPEEQNSWMSARFQNPLFSFFLHPLQSGLSLMSIMLSYLKFSLLIWPINI